MTTPNTIVQGFVYGHTLVSQKTGKQIPFDDISGAGGSATPVQWADVQGKPATFAPTIGTSAVTAKAGNYVPAWGEVTGKPATFAPAIGTTATTAMAGDKFVKGTAVADLAGDADAAAIAAKVNALLAVLRTGKFIA